MPTKTDGGRRAPASRADRVDTRLAKALSHPLRHRVLSRLNEGVASPKELSLELGEPLTRLSYHVTVLLDLGCIELVRTAQRRGATEHYYRALTRPFFSDSDWAVVPPSARREIVGQHLQRIFSDVAAAADAGGFDGEKVHVSWTPLDLDEQGLEDVSAVLLQALERVLEIHAESAGRQVARGEGEAAPLRTEVAMLHFERAPADAGEGRRPERGRRSGRAATKGA